MLSMLVGMKDSNVKFLINDLAACQDKKNFSSISTNLSGRLGGKLAEFRSHTLVCFLNNLRLPQVEKKSQKKLEQGLIFHLHLL